jgi:hypothetical protein
MKTLPGQWDILNRVNNFSVAEFLKSINLIVLAIYER